MTGNLARRSAIAARARPLVPGLALLLGVAAAATALRPAPLAADRLLADSGPGTDDFDADGIPDAQEQVLGTSPYAADTDGDTYGDAEELARQVDPNSTLNAPTNSGLSIGMSARGENGEIRLHLACNSPDGDFDGSVIQFGALVGGQIVYVPLARFAHTTTVRDVPGSDGSLTRTIDFGISPAVVHRFGSITFFATLGEIGSPSFSSFAKVDLSSIENVTMLRRTNLSQSVTSQGGGSIHVPIPAGGFGSVPVTWQPGRVCFQRSQLVGGSGVVLTHEIVDADCIPGWDSFCSSDCGTSVGSTYQTVDPAALLGG